MVDNLRMHTAIINLVTENPSTGEFALILVEDGPWPEANSDWSDCLSRIQNRLYDAIDIAVDGHLAAKYPNAFGKKARIQIDSPNGVPDRVSNLISTLRTAILTEGDEYYSAIKKSPYISAFRIVMGHEVNPHN